MWGKYPETMAGEMLYICGGIVVLTLLVTFPLQLAAKMFGATEAGVGKALFAIILGTIVHGIGLFVPVCGSIIAFILVAAVYAWIFEVGFLRGVGIAVFQFFFAVVEVVLLVYILGVSLMSYIG
jgi:hypothetical protein